MVKKKVPLRKCSGCGEMKPKRELIRVVKAPDKPDEGEGAEAAVSLDLTGKKPGRGAYVCRSAECLRLARKAKRFEKSFSCRIPDSVYDSMEEELKASEQ